jgi:cobalamin biosynthesis protein CobC
MTGRDHGGNLDAAIGQFGMHANGWIDLSTGINRQPFPLPPIPQDDWTDLPHASRLAALEKDLCAYLGTSRPAVVLPGAQGAIQLVPYLMPVGHAAILSPTYNEHAGALRQAGWQVTEPTGLSSLAGVDVAVVVNPNNPDGQIHQPQDLVALSRRVGLLIVDESFADAMPGLSVIPYIGDHPIVVLRSFGKFWGLAGLRLGFAVGHAPSVTALRRMAGPWPVSGAAITVGRAALADPAWRARTIARLTEEVGRIDALAVGAGWSLVGGTHLFRLYITPAARPAQAGLAGHGIWSRIFPWHDRWLRLGLPGTPQEWDRLATALDGRLTQGQP